MGAYSITVNGQKVSMHMKKAEAEELNRIIKLVGKLPQYTRETSGIIGGEEHTMDKWMMFGTSSVPIADPEGYENDKAAFYASIPMEEIRAEQIPFFRAKANEIYNKHIPLLDSRRTPEKVEEDAKEIRDREAVRAVTKNEVEEHIGLCGDGEITKEDGEMHIIIEATFDNSDMMTDYYHPHSSLTQSYALAVIRKGARRERDVRGIVERFPELSALSWKWHKENYSGGTGTYMQSGAVGDVNRGAGDGRKEVTYCYEIRFNSWDQTLNKSRFFVDSLGDKKKTGSPVRSVDDVTVTENDQKNGVEVRFPSRPDDSIIDDLKAHGFRWSRFGKCWYKTRTEQAKAFAQSLVS